MNIGESMQINYTTATGRIGAVSLFLADLAMGNGELS